MSDEAEKTPMKPTLEEIARECAEKITPFWSENYANSIAKAEAQNENGAIAEEHERIKPLILAALTTAVSQATGKLREELKIERTVAALDAMPDWQGMLDEANSKLELAQTHALCLQKQNQQLTAQLTTLRATLSTLEQQNAALQRAVAEAEKDTARLDWLERSRGRCGYSETTYIGEAFFAHEHTQGDKYFAAPTLREAIDAARSAGAREAGR